MAPAKTIAPSSASPVTMGWCAQPPHTGAAIALELDVDTIVECPTVEVMVVPPLVTVLSISLVLIAVVDTLSDDDSALEEEVSLDRTVEERVVTGVAEVELVSDPDDSVAVVVVVALALPLPLVVAEPLVVDVVDDPAAVVSEPAAEEKILRAARVAEGDPAAEAEDAAVVCV